MGRTLAPHQKLDKIYFWKCARVVESGSLENCCASNGTGGSNPPTSVIKFWCGVEKCDRLARASGVRLPPSPKK